MRTATLALIVLSLTAISALCATNQGSGGAAKKMNLVQKMYAPPEIRPTETGFRLVVEREMPTPGWSFDVDEVRVDGKQSRIEIRVTENRPDGMVAQVITPGIFEVPLGHVDPGVYFIELWMRREKDRPHQPAQAFVAQAR